MAEFLPANAVRRLDESEARLLELERQSADPDVARNPARATQIAKELGNLRKLVLPWQQLQKTVQELQETREIARSEDSAELRQMAKDEVPALEAQSRGLAEGLLDSLLADPEEAGRDVIIEIRAGVGGDEAALFVMDLFRMYQHYASERGWKVEVLAMSPSDLGGAKEVIFSVAGEDAYKSLRFESGGHRVQRVPATEAQGRIHTSAATVAVMPAVEEVDLQIQEKDLKIDTMRSGGAGGQHVNKTESAVRITHLPTSLVVVCQDERSQHKNKARALMILRSRLHEMEKRKRDAERAAFRKSQVGSGDRNERVRTYNFPQDRVTDHRINENFSLQQVMGGRLAPVVTELLAEDRNRRLGEI